MSNSVIICVGTIGSPTFERCKRSVDIIAKKDSRVKKVVIIRNKTPQSAWLNQMRLECFNSKWCLQIDEDMYLKPNALDELLNFAKKIEKKGHRVLNVSSLLYDLFLKERIGSLKLWSSKALQELEFKDTLGGDRDIAKRAKLLGYRNFSIDLVLGEHDSAPNPTIAFSKYYEYTQKIRKFGSEEQARRFSRSLRKKWQKDRSYISKKAYDGSKLGLSGEIRDKSKVR
jgi:hypothetical protein